VGGWRPPSRAVKTLEVNRWLAFDISSSRCDMVTFTPVSSRHEEFEVTPERKQGGFWDINEEGDGPPGASGDPCMLTGSGA
jgi:hypothetical protein